jgi:hypothetical protein
VRERGQSSSGGSELPPELAEFLRGQDIACLMQATDQGTAFVVKLPGREIKSVRGQVLIQMTHELYAQTTAPVIRTVLRMYDQPESHLALETYTNVEDEVQRADFASLGRQDRFLMLFYDEQLSHRLAKVVIHEKPEQTAEVLTVAERLLATIPKERFNFEKAKREVMGATDL